jgi:hypothetical protein
MKMLIRRKRRTSISSTALFNELLLTASFSKQQLFNQTIISTLIIRGRSMKYSGEFKELTPLDTEELSPVG